MSTRRGFTLIEVMIAMLIGSVVILLAYSTLAAGLDVEQRVTAARETDAASGALRAMLSDAVRHAVAGDADDPRGLHTAAHPDGRGVTLTFVTRGIESPLGGSALWRVTLAADSTGVALDATPRDPARARIHVASRAARSIAVRFLPLTATEWQAGWNDATRLPDAVEVRFLDTRGHDVLPPLIARTSPVGGA